MSAFGALRTWADASSRSSPPLLTQSGHKPGRNPALRRSPVHVLSFGGAGPAAPKHSRNGTRNAMPSVRQWLASLGLSEYADRFAEHRIDFSILKDLTDKDLKEELGITPLGDRRRLLRAIARLAGAASTTPKLWSGSESSPRDEAERRQVTVMFVDLVGSTALSTAMDPEDLREVISAYQNCVAETVHRFGGFVARYVGDGVLVYFGYPHAHEDDAERAVRAGLELITVIAGLKTRAPQQIRVGIATGVVVVGHLIPSGESEERGMVGETPN